MHEHDRVGRRLAADSRIDVACREVDSQVFPSAREHGVYPRSFTISGAVPEAAATWRHMAQHTTPARTRYNEENVAIGIHNPGMGVTASDVRIT